MFVPGFFFQMNLGIDNVTRFLPTEVRAEMMCAAYGSAPSMFGRALLHTFSSLFYELEPKLQPRFKYIGNFSPLKDGRTTIWKELWFLRDPVEERPCRATQLISGLLNEKERNLCIL